MWRDRANMPFFLLWKFVAALCTTDNSPILQPNSFNIIVFPFISHFYVSVLKGNGVQIKASEWHTESIEFRPLGLGMTLNYYLPCLILIFLICKKETMAYFITHHQIWIIRHISINCHTVQCCCNFYFAISLSHNLNFLISLAFSISRIISAM